jgi:hypothetical protein
MALNRIRFVVLRLIEFGLVVAWTPGQASQPVEVGVAVFNMAWAGTLQDYEAHYQLCSSDAVNWCSPWAGGRYRNKRTWARAEMCRAASEEQAGGADNAMKIAPCNAYKFGRGVSWPVAREQYTKKLEGLTATVHLLISKHRVQILAFQEVSSAAVIRTVLGSHATDYEVCVAPHHAFQTVGFAWHRKLGPGVCRPRAALAVKENFSQSESWRPMRPGLALTLPINSAAVTFMNVHLKSGCANLLPDNRYAGRLLTDPQRSCKILHRQGAQLAQWLDSVALTTPRFVLLGDFNRKVDQEAAQEVTPMSNGSGPKGLPSSAPAPFDPGASPYLWGQIAGARPAESAIFQVSLDAEGAACGGFSGLDHIVISRAIRDMQQRPLVSTKIPVVRLEGQRIPTSDHCPRLMTLQL